MTLGPPRMGALPASRSPQLRSQGAGCTWVGRGALKRERRCPPSLVWGRGQGLHPDARNGPVALEGLQTQSSFIPDPSWEPQQPCRPADTVFPKFTAHLFPTF